MFDEYNDMLSVDDLMEILGIGKNAAYYYAMVNLNASV